MKWHPAANVLFAGCVNGEVHMWKIPDENYKVFPGYGHRTETGAIFPDGIHFSYCCCNERNYILIKCNFSGKRIAVGYEDGTIRIIDLKTKSVLLILSPIGHSSTITTLDCHSDNNLLLSSSVDGKTILSASNTGKVIKV